MTAFDLCREYYSEAERPTAALRQEVMLAERFILKHIVPVLSPPQRLALTSLAADVLVGRAQDQVGLSLHNSRLVAEINRGWMQIASAEFLKFSFAAGRISRIAYRKRQTEVKLWVSGVCKLY